MWALLSPAGHWHIHDPGRGHQENPQRRVGFIPLQSRSSVKTRRLHPLHPMRPLVLQRCSEKAKPMWLLCLKELTHRQGHFHPADTAKPLSWSLYLWLLSFFSFSFLCTSCFFSSSHRALIKGVHLVKSFFSFCFKWCIPFWHKTKDLCLLFFFLRLQVFGSTVNPTWLEELMLTLSSDSAVFTSCSDRIHVITNTNV